MIATTSETPAAAASRIESAAQRGRQMQRHPFGQERVPLLAEHVDQIRAVG